MISPQKNNKPTISNKTPLQNNNYNIETVDIEITDKIDVESLLKDFKITNLENFNVYLQQLSQDFCVQSDNPGMGINKMTFLNYFQLPGIIGERLYSVFDTKNREYLEVEEFINGMTRLYSSNFESLSKFIFDLYDFDKDGIISKEDIRVVLSYIPLRRVRSKGDGDKPNSIKYVHKKEFNNIVESQEELNNLIDKCFVDENNKEVTLHYMNYKRFFYVVQNISSEIVLYILIYLLKKRPFSKETLNLYDNIILKGILTPKICNKINLEPQKIMVPSPSTKSKFSPSLDIKHSPYMKEKAQKAKTTLLKSKTQLKSNENAKKLLGQFALNSHSNSNNEQKTKTIEIKKNVKPNFSKANSLKSGSFSLSSSADKTKNLDDIDALTKLTRIRQKVNSTKTVAEPTPSQKNEESEEIDTNKNLKAVQMRRKYRFFLQGLKEDFTPVNENKILVSSVNGEQNNNDTISSTTTTEENDPTTSFKYNFTNIFQEQVIDEEEEEELKEGEKEVYYEGFLYKILRMKKIKQRYFKLIQKDLYTYEHQNDSNHKNLHNLSGVFIENCDPCEVEGKKYYTFRLVFSKKTKYYYCDDEKQYNTWVEKLRAVTGYSNLNDLYAFKKKLGKGKFATVKLGNKISTSEDVAIKIINKEAMEPKDLELARTEIEIMKFSKHPYIVKLNEVFENRTFIYIIMEYCKGGDLFSYLEKRNFKINEHRAAQIIKQLLTALYYLHSFGIVHRDLKPENVMMINESENSDIRLVDFGLSKLIGPNETCSESFGTMGYAAPEVLQGKPYDKSVDSWSMGIVSYLLITGCLPFDDDDSHEIIRQTICDPVPYPKYLWKQFSTESKNFVMSKLINYF